MGVDCRVYPNFRTYPFVENVPFWHLDFACMKCPSTVKPIGVHRRGNPNFCIYPFVENALLWIMDLACMEFHATVQPMGFDSSRRPNFYTYPFLDNDPFGASGDTALTLAARNYFSFYPPY